MTPAPTSASARRSRDSTPRTPRIRITKRSTAGMRPKELVYADRMTAMLARIDPDASEALRLAARCQHIERWKIPRGEYPMTRAGYEQWRTRLRDFHADRAAEILRATGYDEATIGRVRALIRKEGAQDRRGSTGARGRRRARVPRKLPRGFRREARELRRSEVRRHPAARPPARCRRRAAPRALTRIAPPAALMPAIRNAMDASGG